MSIFKTTTEILNRDWDTQVTKPSYYTWETLPLQKHWISNEELEFDKVEVWEEIYYQIGSFGIYAAWSPNAELYVIVHSFYTKKLKGIEIFYGPTAGKEVKDRAEKLGVNLPVNKIWVDHSSIHNYDGQL